MLTEENEGHGTMIPQGIANTLRHDAGKWMCA